MIFNSPSTRLKKPLPCSETVTELIYIKPSVEYFNDTKTSEHHLTEEDVMYMDTVVLAGLGTVVLVCGVFGFLYYLIKKDMKDHDKKS